MGGDSNNAELDLIFVLTVAKIIEWFHLLPLLSHLNIVKNKDCIIAK